jgi:hypothetical protein
MRCIGRRLLDVGIALAVIGMGATFTAREASAQTQLRAYSAKFVCGFRTIELGVVRGGYETSINIHNPHFVTVQFQKKAVIALPQRSQLGRISELVPETLPPDGALGVDCIDIRRLFNPVPTGFIEGFLVIYIPANREIDVVGVYTARERIGTNPDTDIYDVKSIDVERFPSITVVPQ